MIIAIFSFQSNFDIPENAEMVQNSDLYLYHISTLIVVLSINQFVF